MHRQRWRPGAQTERRPPQRARRTHLSALNHLSGKMYVLNAVRLPDNFCNHLLFVTTFYSIPASALGLFVGIGRRCPYFRGPWRPFFSSLANQARPREKQEDPNSFDPSDSSKPHDRQTPARGPEFAAGTNGHRLRSDSLLHEHTRLVPERHLRHPRVPGVPRDRQPGGGLGRRAAPPHVRRLHSRCPTLCRDHRVRRYAHRRSALRPHGPRIHQVVSRGLLHHSHVWRRAPVPDDRVLSQILRLHEQHLHSYLRTLRGPLLR